ncbi:MAG TPA: lipoate--protein ligase family protein [Bacteroidota bacterium]|nr:lipoate--protein ligase family protein [Bacteroidota bacterium]
MTWRFVDTGFRSGAWNMAFDEQTAVNFDPSADLPLLRVYGWNPPTISIGIHQSAEDFDLKKIARDRLALVRRPTGGRAIFHAHELTYSVVLAARGRGAREIYRELSRGILAALAFLGISADVAGTDDRPVPPADPLSIPCFGTATRSEIRAGGRKIVGSAQRRYGETILQHGSFLLGPRHRELGGYVATSLRGATEAVERRLVDATTEAETVLGRPVPFSEAAAAFRAGFEQAYGMTFVEQQPDDFRPVHTDSQLLQPL